MMTYLSFRQRSEESAHLLGHIHSLFKPEVLHGTEAHLARQVGVNFAHHMIELLLQIFTDRKNHA